MSKARKRVLVVNGGGITWLSIDQIGKDYDASVTVVHSTMEVQNAINKGDGFGIVFLDLLMPEMQGWEILHWIKINLGAADLPVVAVTEKAVSEEEKRRLSEFISAFVSRESSDAATMGKILDDILHWKPCIQG